MQDFLDKNYPIVKHQKFLTLVLIYIELEIQAIEALDFRNEIFSKARKAS